jgi:tetratricopeptide (TPR) repeat protein
MFVRRRGPIIKVGIAPLEPPLSLKQLFLLTLFLVGPLAAQAVTPEAAQLTVQADSLLQQKLYDQALALYGQSLRLDSGQAGAYLGVGDCYLAKGDRDSAKKYYDYALQLDPANSLVQGRLAQLQASSAPESLEAAQRFYRARSFAEALSGYQAALAADPQNPRLYQSVGNCQMALHDTAAALVSYKKSLDLDPSNTGLADLVQGLEDGLSAGEGGGVSAGETFAPVWRSAIVPGWGQAYNGQKGKAWLLGGLTLGLWAGEFATYSAGNSARDQYLGLSGKADYDTPYQAWQSLSDANHFFYIAMTAAYLYTMVDAGANARAHPAALGLLQGPDAPLKVALTGTGAKVTVQLAQF